MTFFPTPQIDWTQWSLSYLDDVYGPLFGGHSVVVAATNTLKEWLPSYINEMNRNLGVQLLSIPQEYEFRPNYTPAPLNTNEPQVLVDCPGTAATAQPKRRSDGIGAAWDVQVGVWLYGSSDWREVQALVYAYMAAIRAVLVQQGSLGGFADATRWLSEQYTEQEHHSTRTIGLGVVKFEVNVLNVLNPFGGPPLPSLLPPRPLPDVEQVEVTLTNEEP